MNTDVDPIKRAALAAVSETFEAMIFTQIAPADLPVPSTPTPASTETGSEIQPSDSPEAKPLQPKFYLTQINLEKPNNALFSMTFPSDLAVSITKNLYGWMEEGDPPEHLIQDSLAEIINTIAGKLMSILLDTESTFSMSLPNVKPVQSIPLETGKVYSYQTADDFRFFLTIEGDLLPVK